MKISKAHQKFSKILGSQNVLNNPKNYLGPNWKEVINFWLYLDTLTEDQLRVVETRYNALSFREWNAAKEKVWNAAKSNTSIVGRAAFYSVYNAEYAARYATFELIVINKLLEQGYKPVFFPMFLPKKKNKFRKIFTFIPFISG
jgi:hypothetical protein